jgi:hypothetical protein
MQKLKNILNEELVAKYKELGTLVSVAKYFGVSNEAIRKRFIKHNLEYKEKLYCTFNQDFFSVDTPETFYLAGFLAADGWIYNPIDKNGNQHHEVGISLKEDDVGHLEKIKILIGSDHKLYRRVVKNSKRNLKYNDSITYTLQIYSPQFINDLGRFGIFSKKSLTFDMPIWLQEHKLVKYFLLGYFDGDASIGFDRMQNGKLRKTPQARLHIRGTKEFLTNFHSILYRDCDLCTEEKTISKDNGIFSLQYTGNRNVHKIMSYLYDNAVIYLDRKYERYTELVDNLI